jgi:predicted alpha/beta hydrolase family esterase
MTKINLLIIPGFGEATSEHPYRGLVKKYSSAYNVITFTPHWDYSVASKWLHELDIKLSKIKTENTIVVAFSLGAYITLLAAQSYHFKQVILCSLSPFYKEQLHMLPDSAKTFLGKRRVKDFYTHQIPQQVKKGSYVFLFGSEDWVVGIQESKKLAKKYNGTFSLIADTPHELTAKYLSVIDSILVK